MPDAVFVLWWITLIVAVVLVLPVVLYLLHRTFRSANDIQLYTAEILAAARGIARNLEGAKELEQTPGLALRVRDGVSKLVADAPEITKASEKQG
jgi:hypothetical protein